MGEPTAFNRAVQPREFIARLRHTQGTETSKYLEEEKANCDSLSSGERNGISPNQEACLLGL